MGKPGAFLTLGRKAHDLRPVSERTKDYDEHYVTLTQEAQQLQASRCMMCGVAFCQTGVSFGKARPSGCPLHNLIPEWNDLLWRGLWDQAAERMALTNPLPEFTGRVCPALCEAACNLGLHDDPTTIRDDERAISDWQWEHGGPKPLAPAPEGAPLVTVVGSGPAGLACAWELARRGLRVRMVEKSDRAGGLLMYGIPNMKLPKEVVERRIDLMRESGIDVECGVDASDPDVAARLAKESDAVVLAAGTGNARTLRVPGADLDGVTLAVPYLTAQTKAVLSSAGLEGLPVFFPKLLHALLASILSIPVYALFRARLEAAQAFLSQAPVLPFAVMELMLCAAICLAFRKMAGSNLRGDRV